ncbi:ankyrin repeat domain-containing protein [Streptomyces fragilis]|uniref:Ankyrin repeat domain-containing protein n=1 Tax=Streptomyces fragilis TaxID=67301 RepID=A0ABV2YRJ7_9ACTN|nr:ankyrin repeat domain-containing protein [Streptomyces fragilis]
MNGPNPVDTSSRRRARRYAVPRTMIERATERRLAGDWAGACAAAHVDLGFDPHDVAARHGADVAAAVEDDLRHLVPDLLRWHAPRRLGGRSTLAPDVAVLLSRHTSRSAGPVLLYVLTPATVDGPQRLLLRLGSPQEERRPGAEAITCEDWSTARHLWDERHTAELRERCGGGPDRPPFLEADGTPRDPSLLPVADPGDAPGADPAARTEWTVLLQESGRTAEAFAAAGITLEAAPPRWELAPYVLTLTRLEDELERLAAQLPGSRFRLDAGRRGTLYLEPAAGADDVVQAQVAAPRGDTPLLPRWLHQPLPDLLLLREGHLKPADLHPLVGASLFPSLPVPEGPPGPRRPEPVRVRCGGTWHEVVSRGGRLDIPHREEEQPPEHAGCGLPAACGLPADCRRLLRQPRPTDCFAVRETWTTGVGRLPKALRAQRTELFQRAQHGDTAGVLALLDAGVDPRVRDAGRRSLLHVLHLLDHEALLPRLVEAGLDLEARDCRQRTPLYAAVHQGGSPALVRSLLALGARIDVVDELGLTMAQVIGRYRRSDLGFLRERVEREHPGRGSWWPGMTRDEEPVWKRGRAAE